MNSKAGELTIEVELDKESLTEMRVRLRRIATLTTELSDKLEELEGELEALDETEIGAEYFIKTDDEES